MAAPTQVALHTPTGQAMPEGYIARIVCSLLPTAPFWVISMKPGGVDGGDPIPYTTQHNLIVETQRAPVLIKAVMTECKVAYNPNFLDKLQDNLINKEGTISEYWPNGNVATYYGYFASFKPDALEIRKRPEGTLMVAQTNWDATNGVEAVPIYSFASGT